MPSVGLHRVASDNTGALTTTSSGTTQASGSCFAIFVTFPHGATVVGVRDSKGNTYTQIDELDDVIFDYVVRTYVCENGVGGAGHTAEIELGATARKGIYFVEIPASAMEAQHSIVKDPSSPFDNIATTTGANRLVLAMVRAEVAAGSTITLNGGFAAVDADATVTGSALGSADAATAGSYSPAATASTAGGAIVATLTFRDAVVTATVTPAPAALTLNGRAPTTSAFTNVRIREVLVNGSGQAVSNATDIGLRVWYSGICAGAPDVSLNGMTTDADGTTSWSIATGTLGFNQPVFFVAQNSVSYSHYACGRLVPNYE